MVIAPEPAKVGKDKRPHAAVRQDPALICLCNSANSSI
jgi:hypothetical protein